MALNAASIRQEPAVGRVYEGIAPAKSTKRGGKSWLFSDVAVRCRPEFSATQLAGRGSGERIVLCLRGRTVRPAPGSAEPSSQRDEGRVSIFLEEPNDEAQYGDQ